MIIRPYEPADETGWLRCRVLAFLDTAYYDNVLKEKEHYARPSVELVAVENGAVVGLIDLELDTQPSEVCSNPDMRGAMIWHLAVHPDYRRQGIGRELLFEAMEKARVAGMQYLEAWTRDDRWVRDWYDKMGFELVQSYFQVYMDRPEDLKALVECKVPHLRPVSVFAHYDGSDKAFVFSKFSRAHETVRYDFYLK
ncbi:GNAT family N-acetyltransferase [Saccharibacillus sp. O23]|uniref:GNAT family N-acetyltransferase n=1 Tax=Saccharibacillus sp. O23 TaxID=2009338 RepID=UPI000B4DEF73|nr:GNAT family N-acetyltransferase [Saccharibacillus sp. O23]OWR32685.1 GNAT family N-acetyltransferase [Saccharibacillus sp. O23]